MILPVVVNNLAEVFQKMTYVANNDAYVKLLHEFETTAPAQVRSYFRKNQDNIREEQVTGEKINGNYLNKTTTVQKLLTLS